MDLMPESTAGGGKEEKKPAIDASKIVGYQYPERLVAYNRRDVLVYARGVNAPELHFSYENDANFAVLPTYITVLAFKGEESDVVSFASSVAVPGLKFDPNRVLHGEQSVEILRPPLPTHGKFTLKARVVGLYDKGSGCVVATETLLCERGSNKPPLARLRSSMFIVGLGGFGGDKGPSTATHNLPPQRAPDAVMEEKTREDQALLYRLSGDYNPLHADPAVAQKVGFPKPILHGLCTYGISARAVLKHFCENDTRRFKSISGRFVSPVFPGETLVVEMWRVSEDRVVFQTSVKERQKQVFANAVVELYASAGGAKL